MMQRLNRLYMARHGQVHGHEKFTIYGSTDVAITEIGRMQMEHLAEKLHYVHLDAVYASNLQRSLIGAQMIARHHDVPVFSLPELREIGFGDWEGLTLEEIRAQFGVELDKRQADPVHFQPSGAGESIRALAVRVSACFSEIRAKHPGQDLLLVGHGVVNRIILSEALGLGLDRIFHLQQDYGCLNIIDYFKDSTLVRLLNG